MHGPAWSASRPNRGSTSPIHISFADRLPEFGTERFCATGAPRDLRGSLALKAELLHDLTADSQLPPVTWQTTATRRPLAGQGDAFNHPLTRIMA
jgi:hypothetical protein